jgi:hypothetical protein
MALDGWTFTTSTTGPCYGANTYTEAEDSGSGSLSDENSHVEIVYQVDDNQLVPFCDAVLGYTVYDGGGSFALERTLPQQHPQFANFYAHAAAWKRIGAPTNVDWNGTPNVGQWVISKITTDFRPPGYDVLSDSQIGTITINGVQYPNELARYVSRTYNYVMEYLSVRGLMKFYNWNGSDNLPVPLDDAPGGATIYLEKEMTWYQIPAYTGIGGTTDFTPPNQATVMALAGQTNATTFDGHPPGTVVLAGYLPKLVRPHVSTGAYTWNLTYRFLVRNNGTAAGPCSGTPPGSNSCGPCVQLKTTPPIYTNSCAGGPDGEAMGVNYIYNTYLSRWNLITTDGTGAGGRIYAAGELNNLFVISGS